MHHSLRNALAANEELGKPGTDGSSAPFGLDKEIGGTFHLTPVPSA